MTTIGPVDPGLQAERTQLSWTRTSHAIAANGLLLGSRHLFTSVRAPSLVEVGLIVVSFVIAGLVHLAGVRRRRVLAARPLPGRVTAAGLVTTTGVCVAMLTVALVVGVSA